VLHCCVVCVAFCTNLTSSETRSVSSVCFIYPVCFVCSVSSVCYSSLPCEQHTMVSLEVRQPTRCATGLRSRVVVAERARGGVSRVSCLIDRWGLDATIFSCCFRFSRAARGRRVEAHR
jgi:hypothetical protein